MTGKREQLPAWKSSMHTMHLMLPVFFVFSILTSQLFSWLQNGQLKSVSSGSVARFFGGGFRFDLRLPISLSASSTSISGGSVEFGLLF